MVQLQLKWKMTERNKRNLREKQNKKQYKKKGG